MERTYCYICAVKLDKRDKYIWYCPECKQTYYDNPNPCVELALFNADGEVLLSERGSEPYKGKYDMPGGFVDIDERAEDAVVREINEELGLNKNDFTTPKFVKTYLGDYPWGTQIYKNIVLLFVARLKTDKEILARDDVASVKWVKPEDVNRATLSIPALYDHIQDCRTALDRSK